MTADDWADWKNKILFWGVTTACAVTISIIGYLAVEAIGKPSMDEVKELVQQETTNRVALVDVVKANTEAINEMKTAFAVLTERIKQQGDKRDGEIQPKDVFKRVEEESKLTRTLIERLDSRLNTLEAKIK